jgi:Icc-related predicted phosphoesterase
MAGDLTTHGEPEQAEMFVACRRESSLPVVAVLGNHDWHAGRHDEFVAVLRAGDVDVLEGGHARLDVGGATVGIAGAKGFVGGFAGSFLPDFGEPMLRAVYAETGSEASALERALEAIADCAVRIALLHYAPTTQTLVGEPEGIHTFLGSGRLAEPIVRHRPDLVLHGHAHAGRLEGEIEGVPVFNVSVPVMRRDFWIFDLPGTPPAAPADVEVHAQ